MRREPGVLAVFADPSAAARAVRAAHEAVLAAYGRAIHF